MAKRNDSLRIMACVPGRDYPGNKNVIMRIKDGSRPVRYMTFGPSVSVGTIYNRLPWLIKISHVRRALRKEIFE